MIVHERAADNDFVTHLYIGLAGSELLVAKVQCTEYVELARCVVGVGDIERCVTIGAAIGIGTFVSNLRNLAFHIHGIRLLIVGVGCPGKRCHRRSCSSRIVRIGEGAGTLCGARSRIWSGSIAAGHSVERVKVSLTGYRLGSIAMIVHERAADNDFVTHLYIGLAGSELLVAKVQCTEYVELARCVVGVGDIERCVTIGAAIGIGTFVSNLRNLAFHIHGIRLLIVGVGCPGKRCHCRSCSCRVVRIGKCAGALCSARSRSGSITAGNSVE